MQVLMKKLNDGSSAIGGWLMIAMMMILVIDVLWRTFFTPIFGMSELSVFVMMIVVYLSFSRSEQHDEHVRLELLLNATKGRLHKVHLITVRLLALLSVGILFYAVADNAWDAVQSREAAAGLVSLPIWPVKIVMVVGMLLFLVQTVLSVFRVEEKDVSNDVDNIGVF